MTSAETFGLPSAALLAWWTTSWLRGLTVTDLLLDALAADQRLHRDSDGQQLAIRLGQLRAGGATGCGLALPIEGDLLGLGGPAILNELALEHGQAAVCPEAGIGLVPEEADEVVTWRVTPAQPRQLPDVGEADRALRAATIETADALADLDVARWRPEAADLFLDRRPLRLTAPPGIPLRCIDLAGRALRAWAVVDVALDDDGASVTASEAALRRDALLPLERAARRGLVAACSPEVWPPG